MVKPFIIHVKWLWSGIGGMALWPFILIDKQVNEDRKTILLNHERIHLRQQLELAIVFFYIAYVINYLVNLCIYRKHNEAYRNIIFEKEAYANDTNLNYLENRKWFAFLKFS